jgi:hypothetical protein
MSDPTGDILKQTAQVGVASVTMNWSLALTEAKKLVAMIEAYVVPPIEAPSLDPQDRAEVDAEVDAEVSKS